jgi:CRP/FNR family transcriptional regulator
MRAFKAVGLLSDPVGMAVALEGLNSDHAGQRANALEMLDSIKDRELIVPATRLWEADGVTESAQDPPALADTLVEIMRDPYDWLRACALYASLGLDEPQLIDEITALTQSTSSLVSETAVYILSGATMETLSTIPMMQRILYLQKVPLFADLAPGEIKQVAAIAGEHLFAGGEMIARQGDLGDEMYIIVSGEVEVKVKTDGGGEMSIAVRKPGEYVGEMSIISQGPRMASLVAAGEVRALCVDKKQFEAMLRERPEISLAVMRVLIKRHLEELHGEQI